MRQELVVLTLTDEFFDGDDLNRNSIQPGFMIAMTLLFKCTISAVNSFHKVSSVLKKSR